CVRMWTRRRFLLALASGSIVVGAGLLGGQLRGYTLDPDARRRLRALDAKEVVILSAFARRMLAADAPGAPTADELGVSAYVDGWLADADSLVRRDIKRLLRLIEHATPLVALRRRRFTDLDAAAQDDYLRS